MQKIVPQPSCADDPSAGALPVEEARTRIAAAVAPVTGFERLAIRAALGRVLDETIVSPIDVPSHTNSAMDGYALRGADLPAGGVAELRVIGTALAGRVFDGPVGTGEAVRIMTGAKMPDGTDTVVMQEQAQAGDGVVRIGTGHRAGQNVRGAGEDIAAGGVVLDRGRQIAPADLGLLASLGIAEVRVLRRPRVAFFSTGDELRSLGEVLRPGDVYDSNRYTLYGMLARLGVEVIDMGVVSDAREAMGQAFETAAANADAVITSGGVSVGEADFVTETLERLGDVDFWKIAMKPGRPLAFGTVGGKRFFGLPGNPVAVMVTFYQFVQPALTRLMGITDPPPATTVRARCEFRIKKRPGRTEYPRGILRREPGGRYAVASAGAQGSGVLSGMSRANCFLVLAPEMETVEPGTEVEVQPFQGLV